MENESAYCTSRMAQRLAFCTRPHTFSRNFTSDVQNAVSSTSKLYELPLTAECRFYVVERSNSAIFSFAILKQFPSVVDDNSNLFDVVRKYFSNWEYTNVP